MVRQVVAETGVLTGKTRRALDSTVFDDAVATQDTITQLIAGVRRVARDVPGAAALAWKFGGFPLDKVQLRGKTGSAEVYGKQTTSWVATYTKDYVVVMMITQGGTGSGTSGPAVRKIWEHLYGIKGEKVYPRKAAIAGTTPPARLPTFARDGSILPPSTKGSKKGDDR